MNKTNYIVECIGSEVLIMDEVAFSKFLKKKGKKQGVIEKNIHNIKTFEDYLKKERSKGLESTTKEDIEIFVERLEQEKKSPKGPLYVLMNFFKFINNEELLEVTRSLREERTSKTRRVFPLKEFLDVNQEYVQKLASTGIKNVEDMLAAGTRKKQREELASQLDIPEEVILELVKLSDITRMGYIKKKLSRLYYNSGLDSPAKVAQFEPEELHAFFTKYIEESGWDGMVPNPADLIGNIASAKKLRKIVEE